MMLSTGKNKRQPPQKPKLMKCMDGKKVISGYCNSGTSALITENGRLYLFGKDSTQADSKTGTLFVILVISPCTLGLIPDDGGYIATFHKLNTSAAEAVKAAVPYWKRKCNLPPKSFRFYLVWP